MNIHRLFGVISPPFRRRRLRRFCDRLRPGPDEGLLDVGGYPWFWSEAGLPNRITLLNLQFPPEMRRQYPGFAYVEGDGCRLPFDDGAFAVGFSNSVIEHVGGWEQQQQFARELRRVGRKLWVQTPAREFFIEPHLLAPCIHWLPRRWQRRLVRNLTPYGWLERPGPAAVEAFLNEVRLLTLAEMRALFPDCAILHERFLGLTKSYVAVRS